MGLWLYVWDFGQHGFKLLQAPPFGPVSEVLDRHERGDLLGYRSSDELVQRDPILLSQLKSDLFVQRLR